VIEPGQTYDRAGVIVLVLRKRAEPPDEWGLLGGEAAKKQKGDWFDVLNLASDTELPFHEPGQIVAWHESLFDPCRSRRYE
jgi:hypothetical protein